MKKILQRIGLLAMAGMLLWGWQGMEAKADDYTGNWTVDRTISSLDMVVTPPVAGQPLPKKWQINTEGITDVTKNSI